MEFNRRHDYVPRSIGELFYSACYELTAVTFAEALQTLLSLIDDIAITLDAAGCLRKGKLAKAKEVTPDKISEWYSDMTDYIKCTFSFHKLLNCIQREKGSAISQKWHYAFT